MADFRYFVGGKLQSLSTASLGSIRSFGVSGASARGPRARGGPARADALRSAMHSHQPFANRFQSVSESATLVHAEKKTGDVTILTESLAIDGARKSEIQWLRKTLGFEVVDEGSQSKVLLRAPQGGRAGVEAVFEAARALVRRGHVQTASPNFLRALAQNPLPKAPAGTPWHLDNPGNPGLVGADVHALAAWTISKGGPEIRVAILDEGVDTAHPALQPAVAAERDFIGTNGNSAAPAGDDAHGTACAGIVVLDAQVRGLAPGARLFAARIALGDGQDGWVFDDFKTAEAIDWCWDDAKADVLSNSWGGGAPSDTIRRAFDRARTKGRAGKGAVVVCAAGNDQAPVDFPGTLAFVLTVGASNQWDQRKTKSSKDGETWWGSNYGPSLDLLAPGVQIATTDISGAHGYTQNDYVPNFNGTSSATPNAAAAAALVLSVRPDLKEDTVRTLLMTSTDPLTADHQPSPYVGHGRLNAYAALRAARRAG